LHQSTIAVSFSVLLNSSAVVCNDDRTVFGSPRVGGKAFS
jgi:hypothetical protein